MIRIDNSLLYDFQQKLLEVSKKNYMYPLDTGTGKTLLSLHHYWKWACGKQLLIVAPAQKVKEGGWYREIGKFRTYYRLPAIKYEVLSYAKLSKYTITPSTYIIFDECHFVKNYKSQRSKIAWQMVKKADGFCMLSATPSSNGYIDCCNYLSMFGFFQKPYDMIKKHAIFEMLMFGGNRIKKIKDWKNTVYLDVLYKKISSIALRKNDCLDLPNIILEQIYFKQNLEYKLIKKDRVLGDELFDTVPKLIAGLRQYANPKDKVEYLEFLRESTEENILIFYNFNLEAKLIKSKIKVDYEVSGNGSNIPKFDEYDALKKKTTLVQIQAGGAGIELQYNSIVVFFSPTWSYQDYEQAMGRAYRNGQKNKVTVYQFITENTIEEKIYKSLKIKKDFSMHLLNKEDLGGLE